MQTERRFHVHVYGYRVVLGLALFVMVGGALISWADTKPIPELLENATADLIPSFRLAASRALVAAYLVTGRTIADLEALLQEQRRQGAIYTAELEQAIREAQDGEVVDVCIAVQGPPTEPVDGVDLARLDDRSLLELTLTGRTPQLRRAAAEEAVRRRVDPIAAEFNSLYEVRVKDRYHEEQVFDVLKVQMIHWTLGAAPRQVELIEVAGRVLAKIFYAEFLVTLEPAYVRAHAGCP